MRLLIQNGMIVTATDTFSADLLIEDGKIIQVERSSISSEEADEVIDAKGFPVFPGGIDPHVHMHLPTAAGYSSDDFYSGSLAALMGGTTTLIDFVTPYKGQPLLDALNERKKEAENSLTDYSFHVSPIEWRNSIPEEIKELKEKEGITSFKVYLAYKDTIGLNDEDLKKVMKAVADAGGMVTAHCELGDEIDALRKSFIQERKTLPEFHPLSRPSNLEAEAVKKAIEFASEAGCRFYVVHVSAKDSIKYIKEARQKGQTVFGETCPHYLLLNDSKYQGDFEKTAPFVLSPPLRKEEDEKALWAALAEENLQTVGTDHCPFMMKQKRVGVDNFTKIANGAGGVEHRLTLLYSYGVLQNKISMNQFVNMVSTAPAKIFGLYPRKGEIAVGSDAELVIWNPDKQKTISVKNHFMHCDQDIFEGFLTQGCPEYVVIHGQVAIRKGKRTGIPLKGTFLKRN
ncbi:MAG: dihydropyrimidinase [Bacteroidales bacterium]|nr:dihydropyrimidinase [Bacteroidales bacterium]